MTLQIVCTKGGSAAFQHMTLTAQHGDFSLFHGGQDEQFAGGGAAYRTERLQRLLRDINVGAQHLIVSDITYENHGQFLMGLPGADPMR